MTSPNAIRRAAALGATRPAVALSLLVLVAVACGGAPERGSTATMRETDAGGVVVLWCEAPTGEKCAKAADTLEVAPIAAEALAATAFGPIRDSDSDCEEARVAELLRLLSAGLGIQPANWHDADGVRLPRASLDDVRAGGGCTNCCRDENEPPVKVHVVEDGGERLYLVRVWERTRPAFL